MKKIVSIIVLILVVSALGIVPARAGGTVTPTDDTYTDLNDQNPTTPPGKDGFGLLSDYSYQPGFTVTRRVYLRFDLSTILGDAYGGSWLSIHVINAPFNTTGNLAVWSTGDDWNGGTAGTGDETTLTWANAPGPITKLDTQPAGSSGTDVIFISTALNTYINGQRSANGGDNVVSFLVQWDSCSICGFFDNITFDDRENYGGSGKPPELVILGPTAVTLTDFYAEAQFPEPSVNLEWSTANEFSLVGFNLYRATDPAGPRQKLNNNLIYALHPGQGQGDQYSYNDQSGSPGQTYYYWVEAIKFDGGVDELGPQTVTVTNMIFLPVLYRVY
jgi:hypothetical protein